MTTLYHYQKYHMILEGKFWYISHDLSAEEGLIRSKREGDILVPQQGWQYINSDVRCTTVR